MNDYIDSQKAVFPQLADVFEELGSLASRKLWHQLSIALEQFLSKNRNLNWNVNVMQLYTDFISSFESRLSPVRFALIASQIGQSLDASDALNFFNSLLESRSRLGDEAATCLEMDVVVAKLKLGANDEAKGLLEGAKAKLSSVASSESVVFSKFYGATAEYRKVCGPPQEFYKAALMFLAYTPVEELDPVLKYTMATDVALAAATGEGIYNFGEVLATPILAALKGTPNEWLFELIAVMNAGDIDAFNLLVERVREAYFAQPVLAALHEDIKKKLVFMCLMNIVFERHSHDRTISFNDISSRTRLPYSEVEWVLMRALSLGLIRGSIDEVDGTVDVTWVQPRVLDARQLELLALQMEVWAEKVKGALVTVEDQTPELF